MTSSCFEPQVTLFLGPAGTGKTTRLIEQIQAALDKGASPSSMVVFCASPQSAHFMTSRLQKLGHLSAAIRVTTPRCYALELLDTPEATAFTGRRARLFSALEKQVIMEDLNVTGMKPKKIKKFMRFFSKQWTELAPEKGDWLETVEQLDIYELVEKTLRFYQGMLEPEITSLAYRYVQSSNQARQAAGISHVFADDYQCMSRASQKLVAALAAQTLTVAGDRFACTEVYDSFPCAAGLEELVADYPQTMVVNCENSYCHPNSIELKNRLFGEDDMARPWDEPAETALEGVNVKAYETTSEEFMGVAQQISRLIAQGVTPAEIAILTPNGIWSHNMAKALDYEGVHAAVFGKSPLGNIDLQHVDTCVTARALSLLDLLANPRDDMAWRCWCGYGNPLFCSDSVFVLRRAGSKKNLTFKEALDNFQAGNPQQLETPENSYGLQSILTAYSEGQKTLDELAGLSGQELLSALEKLLHAKLPAAFISAAQSCAGSSNGATSSGTAPNEATVSASTAQMAAALRACSNDPCTTEEGVLVLPYEQALGLKVKHVFITGFVNGFVPNKNFLDTMITTPDDQQRKAQIDIRKVYKLFSCATGEVHVSYFTHIEPENAQRLNLKIKRIRVRNGNRVCETMPSAYLNKFIPPEN